MNQPVRRAGVATQADGSAVVWSVADGRRGRRWRAITKRGGTITSSVLLEVGTDGRPARLEVGTTAGLLTLHPDATGSLHGNAVTPDGVRHLTLGWSDEHELEVEPVAISAAITAHRLGRSVPVGEGTVVPVVAIALDLAVDEGARRYVRLDATTWRIEHDGDTRTVAVDDCGLPVWRFPADAPAGGGDWPLELDPQV
ncbi:MAG: hypothetical protein WEE50_12530 [Chloroflexota bacterium]